MGFEFNQGWMNEKGGYGMKDGSGRGTGRKGGGRKNRNIGGCARGGVGYGKGGQGKGKYRLG